MKSRRLTALLALMLSGCMVGPDYQRPEIVSPEAFEQQNIGSR